MAGPGHAGGGDEGAVGLAEATDVDTVARVVLRDLLSLPDVTRVGLALTEGGGRRLRFLPMTVASDAGGSAEWCHIDAYDDVPLTTVLRSGDAVVGDLDSFDGRYAGLVAAQQEVGTRALAALPLPGASGPLGGLLLYFARSQQFGAGLQGRLEALARRTADAVRRVRSRSSALPAGLPTADLLHEEEGGARRATLVLDDDPRAAGAGRRFLRETLAAWGVSGDAAETAELCLSELVTNAVVHAGTRSRLVLAISAGRLTVAVQDQGGPVATAPADARDDDPLRVFGRGLVLVDALAERWGSERDDVGTSSWFVLEVDAPDDLRSDDERAC